MWNEWWAVVGTLVFEGGGVAHGQASSALHGLTRTLRLPARSLRVVQPIERITCEHSGGLPCYVGGSWVLELPMQPASLACKVREQVLRSLSWDDLRDEIE